MTDRHARDIQMHPCKGLPELMLVGRTEIEKALPKLDITPDPDCMEIYLAYKGKKSLFALGQEYELTGGDFLIIPPRRRTLYWPNARLQMRPLLVTFESQM
ncbi:MAG: hypothetical protein JKX85_07665 [Phycisphaeraceae bacterium]|nr:hypothetical protein [Phycisphaeraceae bacterium]